MITRKTGGKRIRQERELQRKKPYIKEKPVILIVTEGETELVYLKSMRNDLRVSAKVTIYKSIYGTDPKSIVECAKDTYKEEKKNGNTYNKVWCVYDRNDHLKINEANIQARDLKFEVAFSNPCFELWYLIHFQDQEAFIERTKVHDALELYFPNYQKSKSYYDQLKPKQNEAIIRAEKLRKKHNCENREETENPSTTVDKLVTYLNSIINK